MRKEEDDESSGAASSSSPHAGTKFWGTSSSWAKCRERNEKKDIIFVGGVIVVHVVIAI